jgi:hypothetical protein
MNRKLFLFLLVLIPLQSFSQFVMKEGYLSLLPKDKVEQEFKYKNLVFYPILGGSSFVKQNNNYSHYTPLEDALKARKVRIMETENSGAQVNTLYIENVSSDTVFIMAGEVIKGGKQDRVIADDHVLEPHSGKIDLSVFCVEQSRWTYKSDRNFSQYYAVSTNSVRKSAAVSKNQQEVWNNVADVTSKQKASTSTGTYTALANAEDFNKELNAYTAHFISSFAKFKNCVGFVGMSGDKIIGCDIFASNNLLEKQLENLIKSYSTEAITNGKATSIEYSKVTEYLKGFLTDEKKQNEQIKEIGNGYEFKGKKMHINTY